MGKLDYSENNYVIENWKTVKVVKIFVCLLKTKHVINITMDVSFTNLSQECLVEMFTSIKEITLENGYYKTFECLIVMYRIPNELG